LLGTLYLTGCQTSDPLSGKHDPKHPWWSLEFLAPLHMTSWVEASVVEDMDGKLFNHGSAGAIGGGDYGYEKELARGWPNGLAGSGIRGVIGADLPKRIYVRWQSVVEPQTYRVWIDIPDEARTIMHDATHRRCPERPERNASYIASLHLGLAPGGIVQAWVRDQCQKPVRVARAVAEIESLGPSQGRTNGRYVYKIDESSRRYIDKYGIPYGSW
jgi:hypothetical protein